jgi:hypothetical protein
MKREAAEIKLKKLKEEYTVILDERANVQLKIDQNRKIAEEMENKVGCYSFLLGQACSNPSISQTAELRKQMDGEMLAIRDDYENLQMQVDAYQDDMWDAMQTIPAGLA